MEKVVDRKNRNMRVCKRCGRFFEYHNIGYGYCPECTKIDNENFQKVKEYIMDHGTATAEQISKALGVSETSIFRYLREGRVEIPENSPVFIKCELCHADIRYGRYCQECAEKMRRELQKGTRMIDLYEIGERPSGSAVMHTYDYHKREK